MTEVINDIAPNDAVDDKTSHVREIFEQIMQKNSHDKVLEKVSRIIK